MRKAAIAMFFFLLSCSSSSGQSWVDSNRVFKNAISFNVLGMTPAYGISYERVIANKFSLEFGIGFISYGFGMKYYILGIKPNKLVAYTGISCAFSSWITEGEQMIKLWNGEGFVSYIPLGIGWYWHGYAPVDNGAFNICVDIGPGTSYVDLRDVVFYGSLKIGVRF